MIDPNDALQAMLRPVRLAATLFPPTSRYHGLETATLVTPEGTEEGQTVIYVRRRFLPAPERFATLEEHTVTEGERLDHIAAHYLDDAEQFWRICDANGALRPEELTEAIGRRLRITLPEGVPNLTSV